MTATITNEFLRRIMDNLENEEDFEILMGELKHSTLLMPTNNGGAPMIQIRNQNFIPLFTDIHEFQKVGFKEDFQLVPFDFNFYLELLKSGSPDFIINIESERFPISKDFLEFMDTDYIFNYDPQVFTLMEIKKIKESIDNNELNDFLMDENNHWDIENLIEILLGSDLLTIVISKTDLTAKSENGVISLHGINGIQTYRTHDNFALIFSEESKIRIAPEENFHPYSQLVNLPLFIEEVLKGDLKGIILNVNDESITISRQFLLNFMKDFNCPNLCQFSDYAFTLEVKK